ncbi:hypothetical protein ERJ75_001158600 [Trypanosoma vivax]|nr:hypothetical protein ERJ75_001158600 [Trypanosoma vivax]
MYACVSLSSKVCSVVVVPVSSCPSGLRTPFQASLPRLAAVSSLPCWPCQSRTHPDGASTRPVPDLFPRTGAAAFCVLRVLVRLPALRAARGAAVSAPFLFPASVFGRQRSMSTASFKCVFVSLCELFPRALLVPLPRLLGAALARCLVVLPVVVGRSACGCNAQHPLLLTASRLSATPSPQPVRRCSLAGPCARSRDLSSCSSAFAPVAEAAASPSPSLIVPACCSLRMSVLSVFPRRHLRACLSRLAAARGAQLRTSLLLLLALRDAARRPRRCFLRRCCDFRLLRHRLSPWQARHCAVAAPGAKQCLGLPCAMRRCLGPCVACGVCALSAAVVWPLLRSA